MTAQQQFFDHISTLNNLPTLPHILLKLFDVCNRESADLEEISSIVSKDPSLSAKLLKLVNSASFGMPRKVQKISQAVVLAGTSCIRNMAICACVFEAFPRPGKNDGFDLKSFWWHSLRSAFVAKKIAAKMKFEQPDDAFVAGLLHDIGKVVHWVNSGDAYAKIIEKYQDDPQGMIEAEALLGATHYELGAWLLTRWNFDDEIADSVRYHHEEPSRIAQALPMAQTVFIADLLCQDRDDKIAAGIELAKQLFGWDLGDCRNAMQDADCQAMEAADALGIDTDIDDSCLPVTEEKDKKVQNDLVEDVRTVSLLMGSLEGFLVAKNRSDILTVISDGLKIIFNVDRFLFFLMDREKDTLCGFSKDETGRYVGLQSLTISLRLNQSLLVKAVKSNTCLTSLDDGNNRPLTILDEQIIRLSGGQGMICHPMVAYGEAVGVIVLPFQENELTRWAENKKSLTIFLHKGALALYLDQLKRNRLNEIQRSRAAATSDLARKVVHEVNNPLGIIKNYLKILELKLSGKDVELDEIRIINEEINRVSQLLTKLTDFPEKKGSDRNQVDVNALIEDIVTLTREPLRRQASVTIKTDLHKSLPIIQADQAGIKQVFINLIKNASEAMSSGGSLFIQTRHVSPPIGSGDRTAGTLPGGSIEIQFMDNGPGIPDEIQEKLFEPYVSSGKEGHSGLGLSIVYNIIKSFHGTISCTSTPGKGTIFTIELPVTNHVTSKVME